MTISLRTLDRLLLVIKRLSAGYLNNKEYVVVISENNLVINDGLTRK